MILEKGTQLSQLTETEGNTAFLQMFEWPTAHKYIQDYSCLNENLNP